VTGSGAPTCGMVYKLVARTDGAGRMQPVEKASASKSSRGGRKAAARRLDGDGRAIEEVLVTGPDEEVVTWEPDGSEGGDEDGRLRRLHVPLVTDGAVDSRWVGAYGVANAATQHRTSRAELPRGARRLSHGDAAVPTVTWQL